MKKEKSKLYSNKEIGVALNNALVASQGYPALKDLTELRRKKLHGYLTAILDAILEQRKDGLLKAEELVFIFQAGAIFLHVNLISGGSEKRLAAYEDMASGLAKDLKK